MEDAIADVELSEDEVVVWGEEEQGQELQLGPAGEQGEPTGAAAPAGLRPAAGGGQAGLQSWLPATTPAGLSPLAPPALAAADAMGKATSALARFNQLRSSLAQQEGLQGRLDAGFAALRASPAGAPAAAPAHQPTGSAALPSVGSAGGAPLGHTAAPQDDLRLLGRSLLAAAGSSAGQAGGPADVPLPAAPAAQLPLGTQQARPAAAAGRAADDVASEVRHPDGRWERQYASDLREQRFANGSTKQTLPGGASLTRFANGDVKKALPDGTVEYYFAEVASWQVTHPSGVDVFFFPSGQVRGVGRGNRGRRARMRCSFLVGVLLLERLGVAGLEGGRAPCTGMADGPLPRCAAMQVEAHHPGGVKEVRQGQLRTDKQAARNSWLPPVVPSACPSSRLPPSPPTPHQVLFPDGAVRKLLPDGRELAISAAHLSREIQAAQPVAALE